MHLDLLTENLFKKNAQFILSVFWFHSFLINSKTNNSFTYLFEL